MSSNVLKILIATSAMAALSACASHPKPTPPAPVAVAQAPPEAPPPRAPERTMPAPTREVATRPSGPVPGSVQDFVISAGDRVYFDYDQYAVRADGKGVLDKQAQWLSHYPQIQVRIEGNCDERGTREYNFALGARRAEAIKAYLVGHGVQPTRIVTISYGKERPLDDGTAEDAMAKNRNGHTAITNGSGG